MLTKCNFSNASGHFDFTRNYHKKEIADYQTIRCANKSLWRFTEVKFINSIEENGINVIIFEHQYYDGGLIEDEKEEKEEKAEITNNGVTNE